MLPGKYTCQGRNSSQEVPAVFKYSHMSIYEEVGGNSTPTSEPVQLFWRECFIKAFRCKGINQTGVTALINGRWIETTCQIGDSIKAGMWDEYKISALNSLKSTWSIIQGICIWSICDFWYKINSNGNQADRKFRYGTKAPIVQTLSKEN